MASKPTWHLPALSAVANYYGVKPTDVTGKSRKKRIALARHVCWYIHDLDGHTLSSIGDIYDADHSSVSHGKARIAALRVTDTDFNRELIALLSQINNGKPAPHIYEINVPAGATVNINRIG